MLEQLQLGLLNSRDARRGCVIWLLSTDMPETKLQRKNTFREAPAAVAIINNVKSS